MPLVPREKPLPDMAKQPVLGEFRWGRRRKVEPTAAGVGLVGERRAGDDYDGNPDDVPRLPPEYRWDGLCEFLPAPWAEEARPALAGKTRVRAVCLSCLRQDQPPPMPGVRALAWASDHDVQHCDHAVVVMDGRTGEILARNEYHPLTGTQGAGARHRARMEARRQALRAWQRYIR